MSAGRALSRSLALWPGWQGLRLPPLPPAACQHTSSCLSPCHLSRAPAAPGAWEEWLVASGPGGGLWVQVHECCEFSLCVGVAGRRSLLRSSGSLAWGPSPHCGRLAEPGKVVPSMGRGRWALGAGRWVGSRFCAERRAVSEASGAAMELGGAWLPVAPTAGGGERAGGWVGSIRTQVGISRTFIHECIYLFLRKVREGIFLISNTVYALCRKLERAETRKQNPV